jgi:excisionase family DNA binding protein
MTVSPEPPIERLLYTPAEAARSLGVSRSKIYLLMSSGQLPSLRVGGSRRITIDALRALVDDLQDRSSERTGTIDGAMGDPAGLDPQVNGQVRRRAGRRPPASEI